MILSGLKTIAAGLICAYVAICAVMFFAQRSLLFHPTPETASPGSYGLTGFEKVELRTADGVAITGWLHRPPNPEKAILYFYGNADSLAGYPEFFKRFAEAGYAVLAINYRGYGGSEGAPSETGLYKDADAAIELLSGIVPPQSIVVMGRSLGSGVAVDLASRRKVGALALISPFTSVTDVAAAIYWYLPVRLLARYAFSSVDKIGRVDAPVIIFHGDGDSLIPPSHAERLHAAAKGPKRLTILRGADHIDLDLDRIARETIAFDEAPGEADGTP